MPLDAGERLYTYQDIRNAASYFELSGEPERMICVGLEGDMDGYNPSALQRVKVHASDTETAQVTIVRTEAGEGAYAAESRFCLYDVSGRLTELDIKRRPWEDAAICVLPDGRIVTSGVHVIWNKDDPKKVDRFFTEYYIGPSLEEQEYLGQSPDGHKDSRMATINGKLVLWTRPQQRNFEGKIHSTILGSIEELRGKANEAGEHVAQEVYDRAKPVGMGIFAEGTWGGPNGAVDVGNGWALVECHVAQRQWEGGSVQRKGDLKQGVQDEIRIYDAFMLLHHPETGKAYIFGPHATEKQYPAGDAKWPFVRKVLFPGGPSEVEMSEDGNVEGLSTYGVRDKDMYTGRWRTVRSLARLLVSHLRG